MTRSCNISLRSFKYSSSNITHMLSFPLFLSLSFKHVLLYLKLSMYVSYLNYILGATDHMTENRSTMSSWFILQNCGLSRWLKYIYSGYWHHHYHPYSFFIICLLFISFSFPLIISKIIKILNYIATFSDTLCISRAWDKEDDWHKTWAKQTAWARVCIWSSGLYQHFFSV